MLVLLLVALLHHSFGAEYDANKPITLTGVLTQTKDQQLRPILTALGSGTKILCGT